MSASALASIAHLDLGPCARALSLLALDVCLERADPCSELCLAALRRAVARESGALQLVLEPPCLLLEAGRRLPLRIQLRGEVRALEPRLAQLLPLAVARR